ncbi:MAG: hypothetical protein ACR2PX_08005 [Endozoicomonas sp.]|uniref:hypothetical protein n=1 Tax=Endozoicomonas sp. TaxID=1892382 RepID=UPI003D9B43D9
MTELIDLHQSIIYHEHEESAVGCDQLMGFLCLRAAEHTSDPENKKALLYQSRQLFAETRPGIEYENMATFRSNWHTELHLHGYADQLPRM